MNKVIALLCTLIVIIGCSSTAPPRPEVEYLLKADPSAVTSTDLLTHANEAEEHYLKYHKSEGMLWQGFYSDPKLQEPDRYGSGGDTLLFTGFYLAASSFRYSVTKDAADLDKVIDTVSGLYALTHVLGVPGNMARCAFPLQKAEKFSYPAGWAGRLDTGFVYTGTTTLMDPFNPYDKEKAYPQFVYYTRVSRDQLSGLTFGLGTFWKVLDPAHDPVLKGNQKLEHTRNVVGMIVHDVWTRLANNDFAIRDHTDRNDTADVVDGLLKLQLHSVYRRVCQEQFPDLLARKVNEDYEAAFDDQFGVFGDPSSWFNGFSNLMQYYAWNLRFSRAFTISLLEDSPERLKNLRDYTEARLFDHVEDHQNPHFIYIYNSMRREDPVRLDDALFSLKATSLRPFRCYDSPRAKEGLPPSGFWRWPYKIVTGIPHYLGISEIVPAHLREPTTYFKWQEDPWSTGYAGTLAQEENTGLDFLLPYWMGRYYGFIK